MKETVNLKLDVLGGEVIIRQGEAAPIEIPKQVKIHGSIDAPKCWASVREPNKDRSHVTFSFSEMCIHYYEDIRNPRGTEIVGSLILNPDLLGLLINAQNKVMTPKDASNLLKKNRHFFHETTGVADIISGLRNFSASVSTLMTQHSDLRGNKSAAIEKVIKTGIPTDFTLRMPVFVGQPEKVFKVEICIDSRDVDVDVWFESNELIQIISESAQSIIMENLAIFHNCGLPVIQLK